MADRFQNIAEIEAAQEALRESIERTKALAAEAEALVQKHHEALAAVASSLACLSSDSANR